MMKNTHLIVLSLIFLSATHRAGASTEHYLSLQETGTNAEKIYQALDVTEMRDETDSNVSTTFKIGKNVLCMKIASNSKTGRFSYFCSAGFNAKGRSDARD